ncbi:hypothetical protein TNCV_1198511 [Trichonephila clavipes]|uniref:Uncharacterized protein n=1 Tax=Trichonephila clavipes TaxID=2585209 RepID=A0A8X6VDN0_TRICX|nr:hypothetical protein TNCV_1198511 [Trichonephila clavipes]
MQQRLKKRENYCRKITKRSTLELKDNVFKKAERSDSIEKLVKDRLLREYDLIASEAKCHILPIILISQINYHLLKRSLAKIIKSQKLRQRFLITSKITMIRN